MPWLLAAVFLLAGALCEAAEVKNLKGWMEGDLGVISYDLVGNLGERQADVSVYLEISGNRYRADQLSLKGEYGEKVAVGRGKRFTWDILKDFPAGFEGDTIWDVTASGLPEAVVALPPPRIEPAPRPATTTAPIEETLTSPTLGAKFVLIPSGTFMMGSHPDESGRGLGETQHQVTIRRHFYMQTTEVTQGQWQKVMGNNPSHFSGWFSKCDDCPVEQVSWNDVQEFIRKLNSMEGTDRYGLPTEAQWEYAARAGTTTRFHTGNSDDDLSRAGWYGGNSGSTTHPVGQKTPNAWGLYDMHGNVWEWVQDWKGDYPAGSVTDPEGPLSGLYRVLRGGSWDNDAGFCFSANRPGNDPGDRGSDMGFRLLAMAKRPSQPTAVETAPSTVREPATGKLNVKSNVGGAKVYIDGAYDGEEPVSVTLKPGAYSVVLKKEGYPDAAKEVRVEAGGAKNISIVMEKPAPPPDDARTFTSPTLGATFALIPSGTFMMGSPSGFFSGESGRSPDETQHTVTISRPFYMQTTEVTQGQWKKVMGSNPSYFNSCGNNCPVENVSWNDVQDFIRKLNSTEGMDRYGLPTEAQWEYAARAGTTTRFHTGNGENDLSLAGWYSGNSGSETHPVGQKTPNGWGLYDMHGNVWEWVQDSKRDYSAGSITDPKGPSLGSIRVYRGGSWVNDARNCRSAFRYYENPGALDRHLGFRLLMTVAASDSPSIDKSTSVSGAIETGRDGYFIAYNNGTVSDTRTNLMWAAKDNEADINWANAKSYCENYRGGGYTDWRMPTQEELAGLYDKAKTYESECGYDAHLTELIRLTCVAPWASDTRNRLFSSDAAFFGFGTGGRYWGPQSDGKGRALPVRFGK